MSSLNHGVDFIGIKAVTGQRLRYLSSQRRFSANDLKAGPMVRDSETAPEDRLQRMGEWSMTDIMKQPGHGQNPGVVAGQVSFPCVEERQSCYTETVVVAVVSVPCVDAVDGSQESNPSEALDWTRFGKFPKKWVLERIRCVRQPSEWKMSFHVCEQWQAMPAIKIGHQSVTRHA